MQRFFHRTSVRFEGAIHEQLVPVKGVLSSASTCLVVDHSGYVHKTADPAHKAWRNIPLLQSALQRQPDNDYYHYQLGQAYFTLDQLTDCLVENQLELPTQIKALAQRRPLTAMIQGKREHYRQAQKRQPIEILDRIAASLVQQ